MKQVIVVSRQLSPEHPVVPTKAIGVPARWAPFKDSAERFAQHCLHEVKSRFCAQFAEFGNAQWSFEMIDMQDFKLLKNALAQNHAFNIAVEFHEAYEGLAPEHGYETREDTRSFDPETPNGKLMIAVVQRLLDDGTILAPVVEEQVSTEAVGAEETEVSRAVAVLTKAIREDEGFAISYHANIAMAMVDEGVDRDLANKGAARFMKAWAGADTEHLP